MVCVILSFGVADFVPRVLFPLKFTFLWNLSFEPFKKCILKREVSVCTVAFKCFPPPVCSLMICEALDYFEPVCDTSGGFRWTPVELMFSGCHLETKMAADKVVSKWVCRGVIFFFVGFWSFFLASDQFCPRKDIIEDSDFFPSYNTFANYILPCESSAIVI